MDELRLEIEALLDESVPARDLGICFSLTLPNEGFEDVQTYEEIHDILDRLGIQREF